MSLHSLNDYHKNKSKCGKRNHNNVGESSNRRASHKPYFYYRLAPETPRPALLDESSYDSFHNYETDVCKDSGDDDDNSDASSTRTEGFAVMDIIEEYEVADDSESEDVSEASSGTEDFAIAAATEAYSQFSALLNGNYSDNEDDEFILADTEEDSDDSIDLELSHADFWKCVKCNNKQNNPLYRYCERCYQVRKSLLPPRPTPRHQKSRARRNLKRKVSHLNQDYSTSEVDSDSDDQTPLAKKILLSPISRERDINLKNSGHSAGEGSSSNKNTSDSENDEKIVVSPERKLGLERVCKIKLNPSSSIEISEVKLNKTKLVPKNGYLEREIENKIIQNVYEQEFSKNSLGRQDSGLSSCQESSQEVSSAKHFFPKSFAARSCSPSSTQSSELNTASQEPCSIQNDSDVDNPEKDEILTRVDKFISERKKINDQDQLPPSRSQAHAETLIQNVNHTVLGTCSFCMKNEKNGAVIHSNCLHLCCCYPCALFLYKKGRNCPICNCRIKNVKKLFAH